MNAKEESAETVFKQFKRIPKEPRSWGNTGIAKCIKSQEDHRFFIECVCSNEKDRCTLKRVIVLERACVFMDSLTMCV